MFLFLFLFSFLFLFLFLFSPPPRTTRCWFGRRLYLRTSPQVGLVQARLEKSPTYHALLAEQAEKKKVFTASASASSFVGMAKPRAQRTMA
jgi:hypothetical protein